MNKLNGWINCIDHEKFVEIAKVLASSEARGKGEFYIHKDIDETGNLLLALTRYGNSFVYYRLNLETGTVALTPGKDIAPPYVPEEE